LKPPAPDSERELADRAFQDGLRMWQEGRFDEAQKAFGRCLSIDPAHAPAYSARAGLNHWQGRDLKALEDISKALSLRPDHPGDRHNRAVVLAALGRQAEAMREYESALSLQPHSAGTLNNLAWLLATADDPGLRDCRRAIDYARKSVESVRSAPWLDTLAAAYAECGQFDLAVRIESEACALSRPPNPAFENRLELYRRGISYASWLANRR
jgi:tetratricopeptide (TPR) repeat protein